MSYCSECGSGGPCYPSCSKAKPSAREVPQDVVISALIEAARLGLPADVQEVLVHGNAMRGIPAGILPKMLLAAIQRHEIMQS
jgi:hypothetical protein